MALSFGESKRLAAKKAASPANVSVDDIDVATLELNDEEQIAVYDDNGEETFERSGNYIWFADYSDDQWSYIDKNKDIQLDANQINITQESNSQVIPFEMPRYYDGIDLLQMTIQIHYLNADREENYASPINVSYSNTKIRFYWLVANDATAKEGELQFEIMASGAVNVPNTSTTKSYLWRTRPNGRLNVLKSLTGKQMVDPTGNDWYTQFLATMSQKVGEAQVAASAAEKSAQDAKNAVASVDEKLAQFYKKDEVDGFVTMLRGEIAAVDGLANFNVQYDNDTRTLTFLNGADEITKIKLNTDPSAEWVSMYNGIVDNKITTAVTPVQTELTEYKTANDAAVQELKDSVGDLPETLKSSYYNKEATDALLDKKADKTTVDVLSSDVSGLKNTVGGIQTSVDLANADIAKIQETLKDFKPDENSGREYDITYEDSKLNLLENGTIKTTVIIEGGGGGGGSTSTITIERIGESSIAVVKGDIATVEFNFGSDDCDVIVYRMKSYGMNLTDDEILDNFIADAKNAEEMVSRYMRNDITDASGELTPDLLAEKCPDLRIIKISAPTFTTGKKNEVANTTIQQIYKNGRAKEDNWTATGSHKGQGTSSDHYGDSARNIDINCKGGFTFGDDTTGDTYALTENSVPEKYFNIKVNVASSENANNSLLADDFNEFNPYVRQAKKDNPKVRDTMAFYPCVVFIQETDTTNATVFNDGQWHFYACGDIGNSKKNSDTMGMDPENHKEFIVEIDNNADEQTRFLSGDFSQETWDGDHSFEFRYSNPACTEEEIEDGKQAWITAQNWVVNADDEEFKAHFKDHFDLDSAIFHYLFTERHTMVDNRAKNVFPHTSDLIHWDFCFDYDNDTAMGNDNEGGLTLTYGYEDTDTIGTKNVFNAADSKLWCKLRDLFPDEIAAMFRNRENALAWSATRILKKFEEYQDVKPEKLWIMDMRRKYFRTYEDPTINTTSYLPMMHGNKRHQRRQFQRYQEKYMASKYSGSAATSDDMTIRGYTPTNWAGVKPDGTFHITPYADTYVSVLYGSNPVKVRGKRGQTYTIECPITAMNDTEVYIYNASIIQSIGDISGFYPGYVDFSHGVKLTELKVGSGVSGYKNTNMTDFAVGNNTLLEHLNLQNVPNLKKSIGLTGCTSLTEFYADGSGITGVSFASGGKIKIAHLPAIASLTAKNLNYLTDLTIEDYTNITTLTVEKCATIDLKDMLGKCTNLNRVRITGIDWELADTSLLNRLYAMSGLDENGYNTDHSVVEGKVHVPIIREREKLLYTERWPDLEITYNTMINQYAWKFVNKDGAVLDIQYIDKGERAVDPVTRSDNPIPTPTFPSTISTVFTFSGWDTEFTPVFDNQTVTAVYDESVRQYRVRYMNRGAVLQQTTAPYGSMVLYDGDTPTYTSEETAYKYYLFSGWDKGGYVNGDKDINAVYDICEYVSGYFRDKQLSDLRPVEIYAMTKVNLEQSVVSDKDAITIKMGNDFTFSDVEEKVLFNEPKIFTGKNYVDTGVSLLAEDRSWVMALDYRIDEDSAANSVIAQCFQTNGMNGFRFWVNNGSKVAWGTESTTGAHLGSRDMIVLRHTKGENGIHVYAANTTAAEIGYIQLNRTRTTQTNATLVFGCAKADDGAYERYAKGTIYWGKLWYTDLGDAACRKLAAWTHEDFTFEACGFKRYYLSDNSNKRCSITFIQAGLLGQKMALNTGSTNTGGWADANIRTFLDGRILNALPIGWQQIIKQVKVGSTIGDKSSEVVTADSYFYLPSVAELFPSQNVEPYIYEGTAISFMTDNTSRICNDENGNPAAYWTRSPNAQYGSYFWSVTVTGEYYGFTPANNEQGIRLMFSV